MQEYMYINGHNKHNTDQNDTLQYVITERMQSSLSKILSSLSWWFTQRAGDYALGLSDHNPSRAIISLIIHRAVCLRWPPAAHAPSQHSISRYRSARLAETKRIVSSLIGDCCRALSLIVLCLLAVTSRRDLKTNNRILKYMIQNSIIQ